MRVVFFYVQPFEVAYTFRARVFGMHRARGTTQVIGELLPVRWYAWIF